MIERRIVRADGRAYPAETDGEQTAATLSRGRALLAEARSTYGLGRRDTFSATRLSGGVVGLSRVRRAAPLPAADELAEARLELLAQKANLLR